MTRKQALVCGLMPECDRDSGSRRVADLIAFLQEAGWCVTFVSHHEKHGLRYSRDLQRRGVAVYSDSKLWLEQLLTSGRFELALLALWPIAESYVSLIRRLSPSTRIITGEKTSRSPTALAQRTCSGPETGAMYKMPVPGRSGWRRVPT